MTNIVAKDRIYLWRNSSTRA